MSTHWPSHIKCGPLGLRNDLVAAQHFAMSWSTLSEDVWKHILQYVPVSDRLQSCSRVNTTLYRAAAAATQHIRKSYQGDAYVQLLGQWMQQHGQHLTSLQLWVCMVDSLGGP